MPLTSSLTAVPLIAEMSDATPGLFNRSFSQLSDNIGTVNQAGISASILSGSTWASIGLVANSNNSDYIRMVDSSGQRSTYRFGSNAGGTADGLNIYDESGSTMIVSFSKQSIRFYQNIVGPVFDTGGALTSTLNAATFGVGTDSKESRIQAAINAASQQALARVYVPASMYPYSASSVSFIYPVQMIREGGDSTVYDVLAYGAKGDGIASDTSAVQAAMSSSSGGHLVFGDGKTHLLTAEITGVSNVDISGSATITATSRIRSFFNFDTVSGIKISGVKFNLGKTSVQSYQVADYPNNYNQGVYCYNTLDVKIVDCTFTNLYTQALFFWTCGGKIDVERNHFSSPAQVQTLNLQFVQLLSCSADFMIDNNEFTVTSPASAAVGTNAIVAAGTTGQVTIENNRCYNCGRDNTGAHRLGVFDFYGNSVNLKIKDNWVFNCLMSFMRLAAVAHVEVSGNYVTTSSLFDAVQVQLISVESTELYFLTGVAFVQNVNIHHNEFVEAGGSAVRVGIVISSYDYATYSRDVAVHHNRFVDMNNSVVIGGPYRGIRIENNNIRGANGGEIVLTQAPASTSVTTLHSVTEAQGRYDDLFIRDNIFDLTSTIYTPINLQFVKSPAYSGTIGVVDITGNVIRSTATSATQAIVIMGTTSSTTGLLTMRQNEIDGWSEAFHVRNFGEVTIENNRVLNCPTFFNNWGGNVSVNQSGNRLGTNAYNGRATLISGTTVVVTNEVVAADNILLSRVVTGGTLGLLSVGAISSGSSFIINSASGTDSSVVYWKIDH